LFIIFLLKYSNSTFGHASLAGRQIKKELTEKEDVRGRMANELDEGLAQNLARLGVGQQQVDEAEDWKAQAGEEDGDQLDGQAAAAVAGDAFVPKADQQLLAMRMSNKLRVVQDIVEYNTNREIQ
jgi:hypothetical protein